MRGSKGEAKLGTSRTGCNGCKIRRLLAEADAKASAAAFVFWLLA